MAIDFIPLRCIIRQLLPLCLIAVVTGCEPAPEQDLPLLADAGQPDAAQPEPESTVAALAGVPATGFTDGTGEAVLFNGIGGAVLLPDQSAMIVTDTFNATLRRVALPRGEVTTLAGRVQVQASKDGVGLAARFQSPRSIALNKQGTVAYVADGPTIRRVTIPGYEVSTIAGTAGMSGYVDGSGATVRLGFLLHALVLSEDGQTLYIADRSNRVIRALDLQTLILRTVAGTPYMGTNQSIDGVGSAARLSGVGGMAIRGDSLYFLDTFNHTLREVSIKTQVVKTLVGAPGMPGLTDGAGTMARLQSPQGLVATEDSLFSVSFDGVLRKISLTDFAVATVLGVATDARAKDGNKTDARLGLGFSSPVATSKELYYLDRSANSIRRIDLASLSVQTVAGANEPEANLDGTLTAARFTDPYSLASTSDGAKSFVADASAHCIRVIDRASAQVRTLAGRCGSSGSVDGPAESARFDSPRGLALDESHRVLFVADADNAAVRAIDITSGAVKTLAGALGQAESRDGEGSAARFVRPLALALDTKSHRLYVAESSSAGAITGFPDGHAALRELDTSTGRTLTLSAGVRAAQSQDGPLATATFQSPSALAVDPEGMRLYIAESGQAIIRQLKLNEKQVLTIAGKSGETSPADGTLTDARFDSPGGLAFSSAEQALYVSDAGNHAIRRLDLAAGKVTTWLGDPSVQGGIPSGKKVRFADATLYYPSAPVIAGGGLLYISESAVYLALPGKRISP